MTGFRIWSCFVFRGFVVSFWFVFSHVGFCLVLDVACVSLRGFWCLFCFGFVLGVLVNYMAGGFVGVLFLSPFRRGVLGIFLAGLEGFCFLLWGVCSFDWKG